MLFLQTPLHAHVSVRIRAIGEEDSLICVKCYTVPKVHLLALINICGQ